MIGASASELPLDLDDKYWMDAAQQIMVNPADSAAKMRLHAQAHNDWLMQIERSMLAIDDLLLNGRHANERSVSVLQNLKANWSLKASRGADRAKALAKLLARAEQDERNINMWAGVCVVSFLLAIIFNPSLLLPIIGFLMGIREGLVMLLQTFLK